MIDAPLVGPDNPQEKKREAVCLPLFGWRLPERLENICYFMGDKVENARQATLHALPYYVVNSGSNIIGFNQLMIEAMMIKSSGTDLVSPENRGKPLHYIIDPPRNMLNSVFGKSGLQVSARDMLRPSYYINALKNWGDLESASHFDSMGGTVKLLNRFQARATFLGILGMGASAFLPDRPDSKQETEQNAQLWQHNPIAYTGQCLWRAVYIPEWNQNKRYVTGLGMTLAGACTLLSGFRNVNKATNQYFFNWAHSAAGGISLIGGARLLTALDDQQGWEGWGKTLLWRMAFLYNSIESRFRNNGDGKWYYLGAQLSFRANDGLAYMIGGAEKLPDGTVIDKKKIREEAVQKAEAEDRPKPSVAAEGLMAERVQEAQHTTVGV